MTKRQKTVVALSIGLVAVVTGVVAGSAGRVAETQPLQSIEDVIGKPYVISIAADGDILYRLWSDGRIEANSVSNVRNRYTKELWDGWRIVE